MKRAVVKRFVAVVAVLALPVLGSVPPAGATGEGACLITGTIAFAPVDANTGTWSIGPAVIDCQGIMSGRYRITGRGPFRGTGKYTAAPDGAKPCLNQSGVGSVEYSIPTSAGDVPVTETESHTLAAVGDFFTPTLKGPFQITPPFEGDCLNKPFSRATFAAQVSMYRYPRELPQPPHPFPLPKDKKQK
ncbi:MAG TPA: hypothetical protein VHL53_21340 [Acidimicrobiia bacterium]|nr:hypothetical protein [Acidimicrobiia bacterium]